VSRHVAIEETRKKKNKRRKLVEEIVAEIVKKYVLIKRGRSMARGCQESRIVEIINTYKNKNPQSANNKPNSAEQSLTPPNPHQLQGKERRIFGEGVILRFE
jgi:hypothetical protein